LQGGILRELKRVFSSFFITKGLAIKNTRLEFKATVYAEVIIFEVDDIPTTKIEFFPNFVVTDGWVFD
jgi:hypothetical protein